MALITRAELRQQIRRVTDANASTLVLEQAHHISDAFLNDRINAHGARLFRKVQRGRDDFVIRQTSLTSGVGVEFYDLPANFLSLLRARCYDGSNYYDLPRFAFGPEDAALKQWEASGGGSSHGGLYHYHLVSRAHGVRSLWIQPTPQVTTHTFEVIYAPAFQTLDTDASTLDGFDQWEQYVVYAVAIDVAGRRESDPGPFVAHFGAMDSELDQAIVAIDLARPEQVRDTSGDGQAYPHMWPSHYSDV